ncbi:GntR family transcriptional regulator [Reyranella sp.]|uniref:GntR family transcriptional regulator n=1 Tax=Reyranella sp. TaxID=1929291 RepID=UPI002F95A543
MNRRRSTRAPDGDASLAASKIGAAISEDQIVERIFTAVMDHRLRPGMKLTENALCHAFAVSRARIRPILVKLGERGIVTLHPNRGAFVASPTAEEARDVFEARRTIELSVVRQAATRITKNQIKNLRLHVAEEAAAIASGDRREAIRLSGQFHIRLAEVAGNPVFVRFVEELVARSSLIIALFGSRLSAACAEREHGDLLDALGSRDGARAVRLMDHHLEHIGRSLHTDGSDVPAADLRTLLV